MSAPRRWLRLDMDWEDSPWLDALDGTAAGCWPRVLCLMKRTGVNGVCKRPDIGVLARRWRVDASAINTLVGAAVQHGALVIDEETWTVTGWEKYQNPDVTAAERKRAQRAREARADLKVVKGNSA